MQYHTKKISLSIILHGRVLLLYQADTSALIINEPLMLNFFYAPYVCSSLSLNIFNPLSIILVIKVHIQA